jgi:hypothetical protein
VSVQDFSIHLAAKAPAFWCYACGDQLERLNLRARISNELNHPASTAALDEIDSLLGAHGDSFKQLYRCHNGIVLYRDSLSNYAGVKFYPIEEWHRRS